jgi:hypothetical protein
MTIASRVRGATLVIGGAKTVAFSAHAWVEVEGRPLSGQTASTDVLVRLNQAHVRTVGLFKGWVE